MNRPTVTEGVADTRDEFMTFLIDVDGVMTTGQFLYSEDGKEYKVFGAHDSDGIKLLRDRVNVAFITADWRGYAITEKRIVTDMGYELSYVPEETRQGYVAQNFDVDKLIYMGDGYHDAPILRMCLFGIAPANARKEAKGAADYITESASGEGAVLDACLEILRRY